MVKGKKITKKQLKEPDEFITLTERVFIFLRNHSKKVVVGVVVVLVLALSLVFFKMWEKKNEEEAGQSFGMALELYERGVAQGREGSNQDLKDVLARFDEVATKFPRTSSGELALLYKGSIHLKQGEYDEAIKTYSAFLEKTGKSKLYRYFAVEGLGHAYDGKKDYARATEAFQKIIEIGEGYQLAEAHLNIGFCYEKMGKTKEALDSFKAFLSSGQKSFLTDVITRKVALLSKQ